MTKEQVLINYIQEYLDSRMWQYEACYLDRSDLKVIIKALEQQSTLDKIRTEIKGKIIKRPWLNFEDRERDRNDAFLEVLDIINKYETNIEKIFNS